MGVRRYTGERDGSGLGAAGCLGLDGGAQFDDLLLEGFGRALDAIVERETGAAEAGEGLLELSGLVVGSDDARGFNDAEEHVVERIDVADQGQQLADGSGSGVGILKQRRHVGAEIVLNGVDVLACFVADGAVLPFVELQRLEGAMDGVERGLKDRGRDRGERRGGGVAALRWQGACAEQTSEGLKRMAAVRMVSAMRIGFRDLPIEIERAKLTDRTLKRGTNHMAEIHVGIGFLRWENGWVQLAFCTQRSELPAAAT